MVGNSWILTSKLKDRDIVPLLSMLDYMFSDEGSLMGTMGLNKEQYETTQNDLYTRYGLIDGAYYKIPDKEITGTRIYKWVDTIAFDGGGLQGAIKANRFFHLNKASLYQPSGAKTFLNNLDQWTCYKNEGSITFAITNQLSSDEQKDITRIQNNITEFRAKTVPAFINGAKNPFSDADWQAYNRTIIKYSPDRVTKVYQEKLNNLN